VLWLSSRSSQELRTKAFTKTDRASYSLGIPLLPVVQFHWHGCGVALSFAMASEVPVIDPEALQSRVRELRRFL
jgi:hypothetical protein